MLYVYLSIIYAIIQQVMPVASGQMDNSIMTGVHLAKGPPSQITKVGNTDT